MDLWHSAHHHSTGWIPRDVDNHPTRHAGKVSAPLLLTLKETAQAHIRKTTLSHSAPRPSGAETRIGQAIANVANCSHWA
jgi:hypothetical protein